MKRFYRKGKYNATSTEVDGIKFHSRKEANRYIDLKRLKLAGEVDFFLRQVPFHLGGGVKYLLDFMVFWTGGEVTFEDVKGFKAAMYTTKKKLVESQYPIQITEA